MLGAIGTGGGLDELKVQWAEFAGSLISALAGMIEDMEKIAAFEDILTINGYALSTLIDLIQRVTRGILTKIGEVTSDFQADDSVDQLKAAWLGFSAGLISTLAGVIDDMQKIAAFEDILTINGYALSTLIDLVQTVARGILSKIGEVTSDFQADDSVDRLKVAWLDFSTGLISTVSGAIEDMATLAQLEGDFGYNAIAVENLVRAIDYVASDILTAVGTVISDFQVAEDSVDQLKAAWLDFSAGLISTVASVISDLETLAAFEGGLEISTANIENLVSQLEATATEIIRVLNEAAVPDVTAEGALEPIRAAWAEFASGLVGAIAGAIDSLVAIGDYVSVANITVAVEKLVADLQGAITAITTELLGVSWTEANAAAAAWAEEADTLLGHIASVVSSMERIGDYESETLLDELRALVHHLTTGITYLTENLPTVSAGGELTQLIEDIRGVVQGVADVIGILSSVSELSAEIPNVREVGSQIIGAFAAGFISGTNTVGASMNQAVQTLMQTVGRYLQGLTNSFNVMGWNIGTALIQGMIDGLAAGTSALYQTIAQIVANAIAAAQAAAGVASASTKMWKLGENMVAGLKGALAAGVGETALSMQGLMGGAMAPAMAYAGPTAGAGFGAPGETGGHSEVHYHYHEAEGIGASSRASLRQDFEALKLMERLQG